MCVLHIVVVVVNVRARARVNLKAISIFHPQPFLSPDSNNSAAAARVGGAVDVLLLNYT